MLILNFISWKVSASGMSFCFTLGETDLKHLTVIKQKPKTWERRKTAHKHKPAQPRAVPAHLLSASIHSPCYFCPVFLASYSSSIKPALHYHFHLRLHIPKLTPLSAKKIEVRAQSTAILGKVHGGIQKKSHKETAWKGACFCPN